MDKISYTAYTHSMTKTEKTVTQDNILEALKSYLASGGKLSHLDINTLAKTLECDPSEVRAYYEDTDSLLTGLLAQLDQRCASELTHHIMNEDPKDRLFEAFMARFDILNEDRKAWENLFYDVLKSPSLLKTAMPRFHDSMDVMLRLCDLNGRDGASLQTFKLGAIAVVYLNTVRVWLNDQTPDMAQTMAELDRSLTRLDSVVAGLPGPLRNLIS